MVRAGQTSTPLHPTPNIADSISAMGIDGKTLGDDKRSFRVEGNSTRFGLFSGYYFFDDHRLNGPYPTGQGGATVPGFGALNLGRAQLVSFGPTRTFRASAVNEVRLRFMPAQSDMGQPSGAVGPGLASQLRTGNPKALQFCLETFHTFNHTQLFGPIAGDGDFNSNTFGKVVRAALPRPVEFPLKLTF
jgi:hypothetical protein